MQAFGQPVNTYYDFSNANVVVSLDSDFLASGPASLRYARQFAARRRVRGDHTKMNRLYVVEPMPTPTGTKADHRLRVARRRYRGVRLGAGHSARQRRNGPKTGENHDVYKWIGADCARPAESTRAPALVIAGEHQPPIVHALAHVMNESLGNVGKTVFYTDPVEANPVDQLASLQDLVKDLDAGAVDLLLILGGNPVFNAPVELGMRDRIQKAQAAGPPGPVRRRDQRRSASGSCPETHFLETWGDARAFDGTVTIQQPLIQPLYGGRSATQLLQMLTEQPETDAYEIVKDYWTRSTRARDFEAWWRRAVHDGVVPNTALPREDVRRQRRGALRTRAGAAKLDGKLEVIFRPDPTIYDGRFANNGWLQELPKPITKLTWDNAAILSPATAHRLGVQTGDMLELTYEGRSLRAPVFIQPGHVDGASTLHLGYGRTRAGRAGNGMGFNPYGLRTAKALWQDVGLDAVKIGGNYEFAHTQNFHLLETPDRRHIIHRADIAEFRKNPEAPHEGAENPPRELTLYPEWKYEGYAWGMAIDLNSCTGCGACVVACQAENNIAVVGKDQVRRGRAMHWMRVDSYYQGEENNPAIYNQPVPCMQCENAPCELVCPVQATTHSSEGLNDMVYNRCVGTRYCRNNCPYKVRRFNFYLFSDFETPSLKLRPQSRRDGAQPRRHGEVHVLRAAHQLTRRSTRRSRTARCATAKSRPRARPPARRRPSSSAISTTRTAAFRN